MKKLWWIIITGVIVIGIGVLIVPNFGSRVDVAVDNVRNEVLLLTSLETNVAVTRKEATKKRSSIRDYQHKINLSQVEIDELASKVKGLQIELKTEQSYVLTDHKLLQKHDKDDTIELYGDSFTYDDVKEDARVRLGRCEVLERDINDTTIRVEFLSTAISNAKANISQAVEFVNQVEVQIADFESKIRSKKIAIETGRIAKALEVDLMSSNDGLNVAMNALRDLDRNLEATLMTEKSINALASSGKVIDHEKKQGKKDVSIKVSEYLLKANLISEISSASTTSTSVVSVPASIN